MVVLTTCWWSHANVFLLCYRQLTVSSTLHSKKTWAFKPHPPFLASHYIQAAMTITYQGWSAEQFQQSLEVRAKMASDGHRVPRPIAWTVHGCTHITDNISYSIHPLQHSMPACLSASLSLSLSLSLPLSVSLKHFVTATATVES